MKNPVKSVFGYLIDLSAISREKGCAVLQKFLNWAEFCGDWAIPCIWSNLCRVTQFSLTFFRPHQSSCSSLWIDISILLMIVGMQRISIAEILEDEWFKKDFKPPEFEEKYEANVDDIDAAFKDSEVSRRWSACPSLEFSVRNGPLTFFSKKKKNRTTLWLRRGSGSQPPWMPSNWFQCPKLWISKTCSIQSRSVCLNRILKGWTFRVLLLFKRNGGWLLVDLVHDRNSSAIPASLRGIRRMKSSARLKKQRNHSDSTYRRRTTRYLFSLLKKKLR